MLIALSGQLPLLLTLQTHATGTVTCHFRDDDAAGDGTLGASGDRMRTLSAAPALGDTVDITPGAPQRKLATDGGGPNFEARDAALPLDAAVAGDDPGALVEPEMPSPESTSDGLLPLPVPPAASSSSGMDPALSVVLSAVSSAPACPRPEAVSGPAAAAPVALPFNELASMSILPSLP